MHDKLDTRYIDTSGFVLKTKYHADKSELEKKIRDASQLVKKLEYNAKYQKTIYQALVALL